MINILCYVKSSYHEESLSDMASPRDDHQQDDQTEGKVVGDWDISSQKKPLLPFITSANIESIRSFFRGSVHLTRVVFIILILHCQFIVRTIMAGKNCSAFSDAVLDFEICERLQYFGCSASGHAVHFRWNRQNALHFRFCERTLI